MDTIKLFKLVTDRATSLVESINESEWGSDTPCAEWSVKDLVRHMVYEVLWAPDLLAGRTVAEVGSKYDGNVLGRDAAQAWHAAVKKALISIEEPGVLRHQVHLSYGDRLARDYIMELTGDIFIHSWDLARGIGADDELDEKLTKLFYKQIKPQEELIRSSGLFGPKVEVPPGADMQTKLLALAGRKA